MPYSRIGKTISIVHYLRLRYRVDVIQKSKTHIEEHLLEQIPKREYLFENQLSFAVQKVILKFF